MSKMMIFAALLVAAVMNDAHAKTLMVAHRGAGDLTMPEGSLAAYSNAVVRSMDIVKLDLQRTKDDVIVMSHDPSLTRTMGWKVNIRDLTYNDILKNGRFLDKQGKPTDWKIVRLDEALAIVGGLPEFWIDFKYFKADFAESVLAEFKKANIDLSRVMVATFNEKALAYFKDNYPAVRRVGHISKKTEEQTLAHCKKYDLWGVNMPVSKRDTSRETIAELKRRKIWVALWFVQNANTEKHYRGAGADAYVTDHVSRIRRVCCSNAATAEGGDGSRKKPVDPGL